MCVGGFFGGVDVVVAMGVNFIRNFFSEIEKRKSKLYEFFIRGNSLKKKFRYEKSESFHAHFFNAVFLGEKIHHAHYFHQIERYKC